MKKRSPFEPMDHFFRNTYEEDMEIISEYVEYLKSTYQIRRFPKHKENKINEFYAVCL